MANLTRTFTGGRMNKTYDERIVPDGEYIDAMNVRMGSTENSEIGVIENTKGNTVLTDLLYPVTGEYLSTLALCIGAFADTANDTLYWFVHDPKFNVGNTGKLDLIVSFNIVTNVLTYHVVSVDDGSAVNTTLNFNPSYLIPSVNKIGDLLFFTDNYNPPRFIDVTKNYLLPDGGNIDYNGNPDLLKEYLLVIKQPPVTSPVVQLITQGNQNNYLEERFISFAYRYKYINGEYSATSQWSDIAFLPNTFSFSVNSYLNEGMTNAYNAAIVTYETGGPLVVGIDLLFKQANNNIIKVIEKLDKALLGIPDNTTQTFTFNSSKIFTILSEGEILRLYDNVPRFAKAQTIMGNRLMYGNYIEGYDLIDKYGSPTRLEYETELISEQIGYESITTETWNGVAYDVGGSVYITNSALRINLAGIVLVAGASITIDLTYEGIGSWGAIPYSPDQPPTSITFSFTLPVSYASVYDMVTSTEFQNAIGTAFNILPVYSPIPGDDTSCNGTTFTDAFNCSVQDTVTNTSTSVTYEKYQSGILAFNEPIALLEVSPANDFFSIQLLAMEYVDDPTSITDSVLAYFRITDHEAYFQKTGAPRSLHSNRDYEIAMVYMDEFNRATTALVSPFNTEHVPCRFSVNKNSIRVTIPISQRAPAWAKRFKFVCKADAENYETIYTSLFFTEFGTNNVYFLLQGENMRKVEVGDRYIVKRDTSGPLLACAYATVLEKEAEQSGFITTTSGVTPPSGVYMKMAPEGFQAELPANAVINPGTITTNENNGGDYPLQDYPMNIWDGSAWVDYTVPAGSIIQMTFGFQRLGAGDGDNKCERRIYNNSVTLTSTANYDNMYDWWIGDNVQSVLNSGTQEVGGGECAIDNVFIPSLGIPAGSVCTNYYQFYRDTGTNQLVLKITGTQRCNGSTGADKRRSSITTTITVFRADTLMVFETFPTDTLPDVFFENNLSFPIDSEGNHLSGGALGDVSQDIISGIPGEFDTGFFNCFAFGNGIESYKVRDSLIGRTFNLGERVTTVSAQDYKEARRFADITYSGVYNQETNVNKLNEFNLGLLNFKNLETSFGDIQVLDGRETDVLTLQEDKISYVLAGKNLLSDAAAGSALTSVPEVLGTQIARVEKYGISFNPESYVQWGYDRFFTDVKRGAVIQLKGDSVSQDQLAVVSEANMRTWFRDEFIVSFGTQKLGGYDPYMNEYVLSTNDRLLPDNQQCLNCGITQTLSITLSEGESALLANFCTDLGAIIGETYVSWNVISIAPGATFDVVATYNGNSYGVGPINYSDSLIFNKNSITETNVELNINAYNGDVVLSLIVGCPIPYTLNVIEVVVTSDQNSGETIHTQYRYVDGTYIGPLQTNSVLFQTGTNPVVSRYNILTGPAGSGSIPTENSTLFIGTNKIVPDTYDFNVLGNKFKYLRTTTFYDNTPVDINDLLNLCIDATPITGGPTQYQSSFTVPPNGSGDYLYLVWDLRNSAVSYLCAVKEEEQLYDLCCKCDTCNEDCISLKIQNNNKEGKSSIYFPQGLCGQGTPVTITLDEDESVTLCVVNADYYITEGDVIVQLDKCGCNCIPVCSEYVVWAENGDAQIEWQNCTGNVDNLYLTEQTIAKVCVQPATGGITPTSGDPTIMLVNECFCTDCISSCWTWAVYNPTRETQNFDIKDCNGNPITISVLSQQELTFCAEAFATPIYSIGNLNFNVLDTCNCTI
jgi:hypothetical protein